MWGEKNPNETKQIKKRKTPMNNKPPNKPNLTNQKSFSFNPSKLLSTEHVALLD